MEHADRPQGEITHWLSFLGNEKTEALQELLPLVYEELRRIAHRQLHRGRGQGTLCTTAIVNEAYLKLMAEGSRSFDDRRHFYAVAALAMRQIVVDYARQHSARKRGGAAPHLPLNDSDMRVESEAAEIVALDEALRHLEQLNPRLVRVVELRFFTGLSVEETADTLDVTTRTVKRDWRTARAFLWDAMLGNAAT